MSTDSWVLENFSQVTYTQRAYFWPLSRIADKEERVFWRSLSNWPFPGTVIPQTTSSWRLQTSFTLPSDQSFSKDSPTMILWATSFLFWVWPTRIPKSPGLRKHQVWNDITAALWTAMCALPTCGPSARGLASSEAVMSSPLAKASEGTSASATSSIFWSFVARTSGLIYIAWKWPRGKRIVYKSARILFRGATIL